MSCIENRLKTIFAGQELEIRTLTWKLETPCGWRWKCPFWLSTLARSLRALAEIPPRIAVPSVASR